MPGSSSLGFVASSSGSTASTATTTTPTLTRSIVPPSAMESAIRVYDEVVLSVPARTLTLWNLAMFAFHSILLTVTLTVGNLDLRVPIYKTVLDFVAERNEAGEVIAWRLIPSYRPSGDLLFTWLTALFFFLSAAFHLLNATVLRGYYLHNLARCYTPTRWWEYFFSAPTMIVLIAYTLGMRDRATLLAVVALVATTMPFGYWVEVVARPCSSTQWSASLRSRLAPWVIGHVPQVVAWLLIILQFYDGEADPNDEMPAFVHVILWMELLLFFSFGLASLYSQLVEPRFFYRGEILFQILSLVSKGLLGSLLVANVLILSSFDDIYERL